mmetsp:Transcript_8988/g.28407  ORF Transcript_8988/g.28407 Transcript_8988/m.28407 type:complete len:202 (-) Transcript_8988:468-1073(-)
MSGSSIDPRFASMIFAECWLSSLNASTSAGMASSRDTPCCTRASANAASRFMSATRMARMSTPSCRSGQVCSTVSSVARWKSSGNTCTTHSIRYCCAMRSLHDTTCSSTRGSTLFWYSSRVTPSSWLTRTRLVPTKMRRSCRSASRFALARERFWCWMRTHSRFISAKFCSTKSSASCTVPPEPSYSVPTSGSLSLVTCDR